MRKRHLTVTFNVWHTFGTCGFTGASTAQGIWTSSDRVSGQIINPRVTCRLAGPFPFIAWKPLLLVEQVSGPADNCS